MSQTHAANQSPIADSDEEEAYQRFLDDGGPPRSLEEDDALAKAELAASTAT